LLPMSGAARAAPNPPALVDHAGTMRGA